MQSAIMIPARSRTSVGIRWSVNSRRTGLCEENERPRSPVQGVFQPFEVLHTDWVVEAAVLVYGLHPLLGCHHFHCEASASAVISPMSPGERKGMLRRCHGASEQYGDHDSQAS